MEHIVITESASQIRSIGRNALSGMWVKVALGCFLYYLMTSVVPDILEILIPASFRYEDAATGIYLTFSYVANFYTAVMTGVFQLGLIIFILTFLRRRNANPANIFNGFEFFAKAFCLTFVSGFFIFLWSLLFIIPGLVAAIRYSQAMYILADDPRKKIMQCINESKFIMTGNCGRYFVLNLSFIGWILLANLPIVLFPDMVLPDWGYIIADLILSIPYFVVMAYMETTNGIFYELVTGHLVARRVPPTSDMGFDNRDNFN